MNRTLEIPVHLREEATYSLVYIEDNVSMLCNEEIKALSFNNRLFSIKSMELR